MSQLGTCIKTLTRAWEGGWYREHLLGVFQGSSNTLKVVGKTSRHDGVTTPVLGSKWYWQHVGPVEYQLYGVFSNETYLQNHAQLPPHKSVCYLIVHFQHPKCEPSFRFITKPTHGSHQKIYWRKLMKPSSNLKHLRYRQDEKKTWSPCQIWRIISVSGAKHLK